jgi:ABC-type sugar transport system ATPase subunit
MRSATLEIIQQLGVSIDPRAQVGRLRPSEQTIVEIARALSRQARILLLDEPTSSISEEETKRLFRIIRELTATGASVIFVSHRVGDIMAIADRATVLRDGKVAFTGAIADSRPDDLIAAMIGGRLVGSAAVASTREPGAVLMTATDLTVPTILRDISLEVRAGEIVGVFGLVGSGAVDLPYALYGHLRGTGEVRIGDRIISSSADAYESGAAFVPAVRSEALLREETTARNIGLANLPAYTRSRIFLRSMERRAARKWIDQLSIRPSRTAATISTLSGGNQQKVILARWLEREFLILLLAEPTLGVDVGARAAVHGYLQRLREGGVGILLASSDLDEVTEMANRVIVLARERMVGSFAGGSGSRTAILHAAAA